MFFNEDEVPESLVKITSEKFIAEGIEYETTLWKYYSGPMPVYYTMTEVVSEEIATKEHLQGKLDEAVKAGNFEEACVYRDKIKQLEGK